MTSESASSSRDGGTAPEPRDPVRLYANLVSSIEAILDGAGLGDLFGELRASGVSQSLPLQEDEDILRMLRRIGIVPSSERPEAAAKIGESFIRTVAESVGRTPAQISLVFRLYASGMYGFLPQPICGNTPLCRKCAITKDCDYFNAPPNRNVDRRLHPAKRFARDGGSAVSDVELIALLIGANRCGAKESALAEKLLNRYGSLRGIAKATLGDVSGLRDVTEAMGIRLAAMGELQTRIARERRALGPAVRCGKDFYDLYASLMRDRRKEVFLVVLLDQKNRVLRDEVVSEGTLTASLVHPREVFAPAIRESAASVAFVHNHPSGDSVPSPEDRALTKRLIQTGRTVGIPVLDHVVIGEGTYTSFVDEGLI